MVWKKPDDTSLVFSIKDTFDRYCSKKYACNRIMGPHIVLYIENDRSQKIIDV